MDTSSDDEAFPTLQPSAAPHNVDVGQTPRQRVETDVKLYINHRYQKSYRKCTNAIEYWQSKAGSSPELSATAMRYLCIPATSCSVERMSSVSGLVSGGLKNRSAPDLIESKTILAINASKLNISFDS